MSIEHRGTEPTEELRKPTLDDLLAMADFNEQAMLDTYAHDANKKYGVTDELIRGYWAQLRALNPDLIRREYDADFRDEKQFWRIKRAGNRVIGIIRVTKKNLVGIEEQETQHIETYFVAKDQIGNGHGRELMESFEQSEWFDPTLPTTLEVDPETDAVELYKKRGFSIIPGSEHPYNERLPIPMITMYRPPLLAVGV